MHLTPWTAQRLRRRARGVVFAILTQLLGIPVLAVALGVEDRWLGLLGGALTILPGLAIHFFLDFYAIGEGEPLSEQGFRRMRGLADRHPEVQDLLVSIRSQARPVVWADLWQVNAWLSARAASTPREQEDAACMKVQSASEAAS